LTTFPKRRKPTTIEEYFDAAEEYNNESMNNFFDIKPKEKLSPKNRLKLFLQIFSNI